MIDDLRIVVAQINPVVGDLEGNIQKIVQIWEQWDGKADLIIFPEMVITGYPLEDLVPRNSFVSEVEGLTYDLAAKHKSKSTAVFLGAPWKKEGNLYNAGLLIEAGQITNIYKHDLPNYGVFDEYRVFDMGPLPDIVEFRGHKLGFMICWDFWSSKVPLHLKEQGAECLIIPNGSTYENTKYQRRLVEGRKRAAETGLPLIYVNLVGGQDELVFDGASFAMDAKGELICSLKAFEEDVLPIEKGKKNLYPEENQSVYMAAVLGLRDYIFKSGFQKVLLGLSGGIDSALTAVMAVDALGVENVHCVLLPSPFTSDESNEDALQLIRQLGVSHQVISIEPAMRAFSGMIEGLQGLAHENMQSRARGLTLMSLSNESGALLLSTGNKSEIATGYSTLYGDMCGAYNPLKDIYKTKVFALSVLRNEWKPSWGKGKEGALIPERIITKAPSAELRENQKDEDSLPPYDVLDQILEGFIEQERSQGDLIKEGFDGEIVRKVYKLLHSSEYKRRQSCPGVNITTRSFGGRARRYPMVNHY